MARLWHAGHRSGRAIGTDHRLLHPAKAAASVVQSEGIGYAYPVRALSVAGATPRGPVQALRSTTACLRGALFRVGGGTRYNTARPLDVAEAVEWSRVGKSRDNSFYEVGITYLWLPAA